MSVHSCPLSPCPLCYGEKLPGRSYAYDEGIRDGQKVLGAQLAASQARVATLEAALRPLIDLAASFAFASYRTENVIEDARRALSEDAKGEET